MFATLEVRISNFELRILIGLLGPIRRYVLCPIRHTTVVVQI